MGVARALEATPRLALPPGADPVPRVPAVLSRPSRRAIVGVWLSGLARRTVHATPEVVPFLVFALSGASIPLLLTVMQILAIDLGTGTLPALALGRERAEPGIMRRPPRPRGEGVIRAGMLVRAWAFLGLITAALAMFGWDAPSATVSRGAKPRTSTVNPANHITAGRQLNMAVNESAAVTWGPQATPARNNAVAAVAHRITVDMTKHARWPASHLAARDRPGQQLLCARRGLLGAGRSHPEGRNSDHWG